MNHNKLIVCCLALLILTGCAPTRSESVNSGETVSNLDTLMAEYDSPSAYSFLACEGFLTEIENDEYCSELRPDDWTEFEYLGETFYVQPLRTPLASGASLIVNDPGAEKSAENE